MVVRSNIDLQIEIARLKREKKEQALVLGFVAVISWMVTVGMAFLWIWSA